MTRKEAIDEFCRQCQGVARGGNYDPIRDCAASGTGKSEYFWPLYEWRIGSLKRNREMTKEERQVLADRMRAVNLAQQNAAHNPLESTKSTLPLSEYAPQ